MADIIKINFTEPWEQINDESVQGLIVEELQSELSSAAVLYGYHVQAIARRTDCDEVLFKICSPSLGFKLALVHMTWRGSTETAPWPITKFFIDAEDFVANRMKSDL